MTKRGRILIVDDALDNLHVLLAILKDHWDVQAATSGPKALNMARRSPQPDLILLDIMMPELDGFETFQKLRQDPETQNIPVIFVTGLADSEAQVKGLEVGAVDYIIKPYVPPLVRARLRNHLELKRHRDSLQAAVEKVQAELEVAKRIQFSMLPAPAYQSSRVRLDCLIRPARAVGGDLYDYFIRGDKELLLVAGDVSDKGVPAALFMVRVITLLRTLAPEAGSPGELLTAMNERLCRDNEACMFVTLVCGLLNLESGEMLLASGGHEPPLHIEKDGRCRYSEIEGGPALGLCQGVAYTNYKTALSPEQSLLFYTDGVTDASDGQHDRFGEERLRSEVARLSQTAPTALVQAVSQAIDHFAQAAEQYDDITLLALNFGPLP